MALSVKNVGAVKLRKDDGSFKTITLPVQDLVYVIVDANNEVQGGIAYKDQQKAQAFILGLELRD